MTGRCRKWRAALPVPGLCVLVLLLSASSAQAQMGRIQGTVKDEQGRPIRGATIVAENPNAAPASFTCTVDGGGWWGLLGLRPGMWSFKVTAKGYDPAFVTRRIEGLTGAMLDFRLYRNAEPLTPGVLNGIALNEIQGDIDAADALLASADYPRAITAYRAVLAKAPALTALLLRVGEAQRLDGDFDGAIATLATIVHPDPLVPEAARELGITWMQKGDLARAATILGETASQPGASRETLVAYADLLAVKGDATGAATWYERASQADPSWTRPLLKLGLLAANQGDAAAARSRLERVIAMEPGSPEATQARTILDEMK
jgi:tetratricopeptide (TPR) repeat protein